jgi:hypothetical protein
MTDGVARRHIERVGDLIRPIGARPGELLFAPARPTPGCAEKGRKLFAALCFHAGCSPPAGGGSATGSAGASTGSEETTAGSCSGATSTAGLGVGSGAGSALGVV